jgi:dipeptidyl aminopeptidase/acylaminoacyl peptidase
VTITASITITATFTPTPTPRPPTLTPTLTATKEIYLYQAELPEGNYLLFTSNQGIDVKTDDGIWSGPFLTIPPAIIFWKSLSPDARRFVYTLESSHATARLMMLDANDQRLREIESGKGCLYHSFAPDGQHLAAVCQEGQDPPGIFVIDVLNEVRSPALIYVRPNAIQSLAWSPDGKTIAYTTADAALPVSDTFDPVYLLDTSCFKEPRTCPGSTRLLTWSEHSFFKSPITWSPDNQNIVIRDGAAQLKIIQVKDGRSENITRVDGQIIHAVYEYAWAPDNASLAFTAWVGNFTSRRKELFIIPATGGERIALLLRVDMIQTGPLYDWVKLMNFKAGRIYLVNELNQNLGLYEGPTLKGKPIQMLKTNDTVVLLEGPVQADGYSWWKVKVNNDVIRGWVALVTYGYNPVK